MGGDRRAATPASRRRVGPRPHPGWEQPHGLMGERAVPAAAVGDDGAARRELAEPVRQLVNRDGDRAGQMALAELVGRPDVEDDVGPVPAVANNPSASRARVPSGSMAPRYAWRAGSVPAPVPVPRTGAGPAVRPRRRRRPRSARGCRPASSGPGLPAAGTADVPTPWSALLADTVAMDLHYSPALPRTDRRTAQDCRDAPIDGRPRGHGRCGVHHRAYRARGAPDPVRGGPVVQWVWLRRVRRYS